MEITNLHIIRWSFASGRLDEYRIIPADELFLTTLNQNRESGAYWKSPLDDVFFELQYIGVDSVVTVIDQIRTL